MSEFDQETFEQAKRGAFLQVLFKAARLANERSIAHFRQKSGNEDIRAAHTSLFPHITYDGIRLTELADKLGVTKQAVQQLVDELEKMEMVERIPDPSDGRAKLIRWSERGKSGMASGVDLLKSLEREYSAVVGPENLKVAHRVLLQIVEHLEAANESSD